MFIRFQNNMFTSLLTDKRMDGQVKDTMPPPAVWHDALQAQKVAAGP